MLPVTPTDKTHLLFYVPGLFQPLELWRKDFAFQPVAEHLLRLCASLTVELLPVQGLENTLFQRAGLPEGTEIPFACYRYQQDFGELPAQPVLCADPVCLQSGIDQVMLQANLPVLTEAETNTLLALLNQHLAEDGLQLVATHPQRWYLLGERIAASPLLTVPLSQALGQGIFPLLPQGDKRYWHRLLNELQMLLHSSGVSSTNALWLWGATNPSSLPPLQKGGRGGFLGPSITAQTLSLATHLPHHPATSLADCHLPTGSYHIILEDLLQPAVSDHMQAWQQALNVLETHWFAPALAGMKSGQFSVSLTACDGRILHCQPTSAWKFWQTPSARWEQLGI